MDFDKKLFFDNVSYLVRKSEKKIGDLEKAAGVSPGYISRTSKEGGAKPGIEFVMKIAEELHVSMDLLVRRNLLEMTPTEEYLSEFLVKLQQDTAGEKLVWNRETAEELNHMEAGEHPLLSDEMIPGSDPETGYPDDRLVVMFVSHAYGLHTVIAEDCFHLRLKNHSVLYLMSVKPDDDANDDAAGNYELFGPAYELWFAMSDGSKHYVCNSETLNILGTLTMELHDLVVEQSKHPQVKKDVRAVIDAFMNGDIEDDEKVKFELPDDEIPF